MTTRVQVRDECAGSGGGRGRRCPATPRRMAGGILVALSLLQASGGYAAKPEPPPSDVVQRGLLRIVLRASGAVAAGADVPVHARASGPIISLPVELGQSVKKGQLLLEIGPGEYTRRLALSQAEDLESSAQLRMAQIRHTMGRNEFARVMATVKAELDAAVETFKAARTDFERVDRRYKDKQATEREWREAQGAVDVARRNELELRRKMKAAAATTHTLELQRQEVALREAAAKRTKAAVEVARAELAKTRLVSPIDGVVTDLSVVRDGVIAPAAVEVSLPALTVSDLSKIVVTAEIEEDRIRDIQLNLAASVSLPAYPERSFLGRIVSISPRGRRNGEKTVFPIRIAIEGDPGDAARPGLTAQIAIVAIEKPKALLVDVRAVRKVGAESRVTVLEQGKPPQERKIKVGRSDGVRVEVLEGLKEGDRVALPRSG